MKLMFKAWGGGVGGGVGWGGVGWFYYPEMVVFVVES